MAVVGDAYIVVRAITNQVKDDIKRGFDGADREGGKAGDDAGRSFSKGFKKSMGGGGGGGGGGGMFSSLRGDADQAKMGLDRLITTGYMLGPALAGLISIAGGLAGGLFALGSQAAAAGPSLLALLNVFSSLAQAGGVLKVAFSGIGDALGAASQTSGGAAQDMSKQIEAAEKRIDNAKKRVLTVKKQNERATLSARKQQEDADKAYQDSIKNQTKAAERVVEAEKNILKAQEETTKAREEAIEAIQQLGFALEDAVLSEQRAVLNFEDAREALAKVQNLLPNNRARREAELAFAEADLKLRKAKDNTLDTQKEVDDSVKKGVEGSDRVVSAIENETDAKKALANAQEGVEQAAIAVTEAIQGQADATNNLTATVEENKARMAEAKESLLDAKDALKDLKSETGGASGGVDKFAEAMAKLSPNAQGFVRELISIKEKFKEVKLATQEALFGTLTKDVSKLADVWFPKLKELMPGTATEIGKVATKLTEVVTESGNIQQIENIWKSNDVLISNFGGATANLVDIFIDLMEAATPLAEEFAAWIETLTGGWKETVNADRESGKLSETLTNAAGVARVLAGVFGDLFATIGNIGKAAAGPGSGGEMLLNTLKEVTGKWRDFTGSKNGQERLEKFFINIVPLVSEVGGLIADIGKAFFNLTESSANAKGGDPTAKFVESLRNVVAIFAEIGPDLVGVLPTIGKGFEAAAQAIANLTSGGALEAFFGFLTKFAEFAADITASPVFQKIFSIVAPAFALSRALSLVLKFARFLFLGAIIGNITKFAGAFVALKSAVSTVLFNIKMLFFIFGTGPVLLFTAVIIGLVAAFVAMWNESEIFREAIKDLIDNVIQRAIEIFERLKAKVEEALKPLGGTTGVVDKLKVAFKFLGDIIGKYIIPLLEGGLKNGLDIIGAIFGTIIDTIGKFIAAFMRIFNGIKEGDISEIFAGIVDAIIAPFSALIGNLVDLFTRIWDNVITAVKKVLGIASPSQVFTDIATAIFDAIIGVITFLPEKFLEFFTTMWTNASNFVTNTIGPELLKLPGKITGWISGLWDQFLKGLEVIWGKIVSFIDIAGKVGLFILGLPGKFGRWLRGIWDSFYEFLTGPDGPWEKIKAFFGGTGPIANFIRGLGAAITNWAGGIWDGIGTSFLSILRKIVNWWNDLSLELRVPSNAVTDFMKLSGLGFTVDTPNFNPSWLAKGGVVPPSRGGTLAVIGEAGRPERVEPLDPDGLSKRDKAMITLLSGGSAGGATINVYPSEGMDERELAQMVSRELAFMMRRGTL